jgi:hypothetical protein
VKPGEGGEPSAVELAARPGHLLLTHVPGVVDRLRPHTVLYLHVAAEAVAGVEGTEVARVEGIGPIGLDQLRAWLATDQVVLRPVLDPAGIPPLDAYEVRGNLRDAVLLTHPYEVFPYGTLRSRAADHDHTTRYQPMNKGGPPGQTRLDNLGPLGRGHHNAKTSGAFTCHQPLPGMFLWQTPTGHWYQVDNLGTHHLGRQTPTILRQQRQPPQQAPRPAPPEMTPMEAHFAAIIDAA